MNRRTLLAAALTLSLTAVASAQPGAPITPPDAAALEALRPVAARGAAALVYFPDGGPLARTTVVTLVDAPLAVVRSALVDAARWPAFMPALRTVTELSRHGRRAAYRFELPASLLTVNAALTIAELGARRVDFVISESELGPAGARWDLRPMPDGRTMMVLTSWSDPQQGHWLLRQASRNPSFTAGMNVAVDLALSLAVARRARDLAGQPTPVRPPAADVPAGPLAPPPPGPWLDLNLRYYVLAFQTDAEGAVRQVTATGQTWGSAEELRARIEDVSAWSQHIPGVRESAWREGGEVARLVLRTSFDEAEGAVRRRVADDGAVMVEGSEGLAGTSWRWDLYRAPQYGTVVALTGGAEAGLAGMLARVATEREPFLVPGVAAMRRLVWVRYMLAGLAPLPH